MPQRHINIGFKADTLVTQVRERTSMFGNVLAGQFSAEFFVSAAELFFLVLQLFIRGNHKFTQLTRLFQLLREIRDLTTQQ